MSSILIDFHFLERAPSCFQLIGLDFMISTDWNIFKTRILLDMIFYIRQLMVYLSSHSPYIEMVLNHTIYYSDDIITSKQNEN